MHSGVVVVRHYRVTYVREIAQFVHETTQE